MTKKDRKQYREWAESVLRTAPRYVESCYEELAAHNRAKARGWCQLPRGGCDTPDPDEENGLVILQRLFKLFAAKILVMYREGKL